MSVELIRLAQGTLDFTTLTSSDAYLIKNFPVQTDQPSVVPWFAERSEGIQDGVLVRGMDGSGGLHGFASGELTFYLMTQKMLIYMFENCFNSKYVAPVTIYVPHPVTGMQAYNCQMEFPTDVQAVGERNADIVYSNVVFRWNRGVEVGEGSSELTYREYLDTFSTASLVAYWKFDETSGVTASDETSNSYDGTYGSAIALDDSDSWDSAKGVTFDGTLNSDVDVYSIGFSTNFPYSAGTILIRASADTAALTDSTQRGLFGFGVDDNNWIKLYKSATNNTVTLEYVAGGTSYSFDFTINNNKDYVYIFTWGASGASADFNDDDSSSVETSIGTWYGTLVSDRAVIGKLDTDDTASWDGTIYDCMILNRALTLTERNQLQTLGDEP